MKKLVFAFKDLEHLDAILSSLDASSYDIIETRKHSVVLAVKKYSRHAQAYVYKRINQ